MSHILRLIAKHLCNLAVDGRGIRLHAFERLPRWRSRAVLINDDVICFHHFLLPQPGGSSTCSCGIWVRLNLLENEAPTLHLSFALAFVCVFGYFVANSLAGV